MHVTLKDLTIKDIKTFTDLFEDHIIMESNKNSTEYVDGHVKYVRPWFGYFDL